MWCWRWCVGRCANTCRIGMSFRTGRSGPGAGIDPQRGHRRGQPDQLDTTSLPTDVSDPSERMKAIHDSSQGAKAIGEALTAHQIMGLTETTPPGRRHWPPALTPPVGSGNAAPLNLVVANAPGPDFPLQMAGFNRGKTGADRSAGDGHRTQRHLLQLPRISRLRLHHHPRNRERHRRAGRRHRTGTTRARARRRPNFCTANPAASRSIIAMTTARSPATGRRQNVGWPPTQDSWETAIGEVTAL